jgi:ABC-type antimicrobial peptide transport system ATPase subunit
LAAEPVTGSPADGALLAAKGVSVSYGDVPVLRSVELNPRKTIAQSVEVPLVRLTDLNRAQRRHLGYLSAMR